MKEEKTVIIIVGPTASGKTNVSIELADYYKTEIISADSRQCFKELNIGVAKPPDEALQSIKHYFINSHSIHDEVNAQVFEQYALNAAEEIFKKHDIAVMVGGTGMYIKAFCEGLDEMPAINTSARNEIIKAYEAHGLKWLQNKVSLTDPLFWKTGEQQNPQRLMRALEVFEATGKSIVHFKKNQKKERQFKIIKIGIEISKDQLHNNINERVDTMIKAGLIDEVVTLIPDKDLNALQTVGYQEVFNYLNNCYSLNEALEKIKSNTRRYAKRQLTWFKKDAKIKWLLKRQIKPFLSGCIILS